MDNMTAKMSCFGSLLEIIYYLEKEDFANLLAKIGGVMPEGSAICSTIRQWMKVHQQK